MIKKHLYIYTLFLGIFAILYHPVFIEHKAYLYDENNLIENIQAGVLIFNSILFLLAAFKKRDDRLLMLFFSWLMFSFFLREVDVEKFNLPAIIIFLGGHGIGRNSMLAIGFLTIIFFYFKKPKEYNQLFKKYAFTFEGLLIAQAAVWLFISDFCEKSHALAYHQYYEELFELYGYLLLFFAALSALKREKNI